MSRRGFFFFVLFVCDAGGFTGLFGVFFFGRLFPVIAGGYLQTEEEEQVRGSGVS